MNVEVRADDERPIEVLASGLPIHEGAQLAVDITLRPPLTSGGLPRPEAAHVDAAVQHSARVDKECRTSPKEPVPWWLSVWRWVAGGADAATFVDHLPQPVFGRFPLFCAGPQGASLVSERWDTWRGPEPDLADLFGDVCVCCECDERS